MDFQEQLRAAGLPEDTEVTVHPHPDGRVYRLTRGGRGAELLLTDEARKMYGDGPSVMMVITRLKQAAQHELPDLRDGEYERIVFQGD